MWLLSLSPYAVSISLASAVIKETAANEQEQAYIIPRPSTTCLSLKLCFICKLGFIKSAWKSERPKWVLGCTSPAAWQGKAGCRVVRAQGTPSLPLWFWWKDISCLFWLLAKTPCENSKSVEVEVVWMEDSLEQDSCFHLPCCYSPSPQLSPLQQGMEAAPTSAALHPPLGIHTKRGELSLSYTAFSICSYCGPTLKMQHLTPSLSVSTGS